MTDNVYQLDDLDIRMLQKSSLDPCPQAADEILFLRAENDRLRAVNTKLLEALSIIVARCEQTRHPVPQILADAILIIGKSAIAKATGGRE